MPPRIPPTPAPGLTRALARLAACALAIAAAAILLAASAASAANFSVGQNADRLIGATSYTGTAFDDGSRMTYALDSPNGVAVDGSGSVYVADTDANRVARWATTPATDGAAMSNVLMKSSGSQQSWLPTCSGGTAQPEQVFATGDGASLRLGVVDRYNSRVVLFTSEPTTDGATGTVFLGQSSGGGCSTNRGGATAANTLATPTAVWTDGTKVAVADEGNHRVLLWNSFPSTGQAADVVLGQADFVSGLPNRGGSAGQNTFSGPHGVTFDGSYLYVTDSSNHRTMVFAGWPATNGANAAYVLGQPNFTSTTASCNASGVSYPQGVATTGSGASHKLVVASQNQRRVLVYTGFQAAPANGMAATDVLGQANLTTCTTNRGAASAAANTLRDPNGVAIDGAGVWVADVGNHRVLRFPALTTGTSATRVIGHAGATALTASTPMDGADTNTFGWSSGASSAHLVAPVPSVAPDGSLIVADPHSDAVDMWLGGAPASDNALWGRRWGQSAHQHAGDSGPGKQVTASSTCDPKGTWTDGTRFLLADSCNNRVLVWTTYPSSDTDPADYVLGQSNFTNNASAQGTTGMDKPYGVTSDGTDVYVADTSNDRVIVFRGFWAAPSNGKAADVLLGQTTWSASSGATSSTRLNNPSGIDIDSDRLVVADHDGSRVAIWNSASTLVGGEAINAVIGQSNATSSSTGGIAEDTSDVAVEANAVFWVEDCRAFVLDPIPTSGFVTAGASQVGTGCATTPTQAGVHSPGGIDVHAGRVWISSGSYSRVTRWTDTTAPTITVAPTATVRCDGTVTISWTTSESTTSEVYYDTVTRGGVYASYASSSIDATFTGLTHARDLSFASPGTKYAMVRSVDWNTQAVTSAEFSFTVPTNCPAPTTMLGDDANAQAGTGRANPSASNSPAIATNTFHTSWNNVSGVTMDSYQSQTWTTPPEHAGGLWHLDSSTAADPNAATSNAISWSGAPGYTTGRFGSGISLNGTSQYGTIADNAALRKANDFTVDAWFRTSTIANGAYPTVVMKSDTGFDCGNTSRCNYSIEFDRGANSLCGAVTTTANVEISACRSATGIVNGQWHHAAMTVTSSNQLSLYVDGVLAGGPTALGNPVRTGADAVSIGRSNSGLYYFQGDIDEVRFAPVAYDAAAIAGYYRTSRPHATMLHDTAVDPLSANCVTAARCADSVYGSPVPGNPDILRDGARYWQRSRLNTLTNDYWSTWGLDWIETTTTTSINVTVGSTVSLGTGILGADQFGASTVRVTTNAGGGYQLAARDESDAWGLERIGGGPTLPDRQDGSVAPAAWSAGTSGFFGVSVRDATGGRLGKWGPGTGTALNDVTNNWFTGLENTSDVVLHQRATYALTPDDIELVLRANAGLAQAPGSYDGVITLTATALP